MHISTLEAQQELLQKSRQRIEEGTALTWAARAVAAYQLSRGITVGLSQQPNTFLRDCADYYHEALEHAALADPSGKMVREISEYVQREVPAEVL